MPITRNYIGKRATGGSGRRSGQRTGLSASSTGAPRRNDPPTKVGGACASALRARDPPRVRHSFS